MQKLSTCVFKIWGTEGIPHIFWFGEFNGSKVLVMQYCGPTLTQIFKWCNKTFTLTTICCIGIQLLYRLEKMHAAGWLHCDLKPENIAVGIKETGK